MSSQATVLTDTKDINPPVDKFFASHFFCQVVGVEAASSASVDYEGVSTLVSLAHSRPDLYPVYSTTSSNRFCPGH